MAQNKTKLPTHIFREQEFTVCRKTEQGGYILKGNGTSPCRIYAGFDRCLTSADVEDLTRILDSCVIARTEKEKEERPRSLAVLDLACIFLGPVTNYIFAIRNARQKFIDQ